jgi:hypothetical protein
LTTPLHEQVPEVDEEAPAGDSTLAAGVLDTYVYVLFPLL